MSRETLDRLEEALRAHVADETDGGFLTDWHIVAAAAPSAEAGSTDYCFLASDSPRHSLLGLLALAQCDFDEMDDE